MLILTFQYVISILHLYDSLYNRPLSNFSQKSVLAVYSKTEAAYYYLYSCIEYSRKLTVLENTVFPKPHVFSVGFLHPSCVDFFKRRKRGFCQSCGDISPPTTYNTTQSKNDGDLRKFLSIFFARHNTDDFSKCQKWTQKNRKPFLDFLSWCAVLCNSDCFIFC